MTAPRRLFALVLAIAIFFLVFIGGVLWGRREMPRPSSSTGLATTVGETLTCPASPPPPFPVDVADFTKVQEAIILCPGDSVSWYDSSGGNFQMEFDDATYPFNTPFKYGVPDPQNHYYYTVLLPSVANKNPSDTVGYKYRLIRALRPSRDPHIIVLASSRNPQGSGPPPSKP